MAEKTTGLKEAVVTLHELTDEEKIQLQCEARERREFEEALIRGRMRRLKEEGVKEGMVKGSQSVNQLIQYLARDGRLEELVASANDQALQEELMREYHLR